MANYEGNPLISRYGSKTRFGAGNCPYRAQRMASPPWTFRKIAQQIAGFRPCMAGSNRSVFELEDEDILRCFREIGEPITLRHLLMARLTVMALHDHSSMERLIRLVDGPLK